VITGTGNSEALLVTRKGYAAGHSATYIEFGLLQRRFLVLPYATVRHGSCESSVNVLRRIISFAACDGKTGFKILYAKLTGFFF
jgi:hypothetical protein